MKPIFLGMKPISPSSSARTSASASSGRESASSELTEGRGPLGVRVVLVDGLLGLGGHEDAHVAAEGAVAAGRLVQHLAHDVLDEARVVVRLQPEVALVA